MFFVVALLIWTALHVYLFFRAAAVPVIARYLHRSVLAGTLAFLWLIVPLSHSFESDGTAAWTLEWAGATWLGVGFLLFCALFFADVITAFGFLFRGAAPAIRGWALVAGAILAATALVQGTRAPVVRNYEIELENLPPESDGTVVVLASDLHLGAIVRRRWLDARVSQIQQLHPDVVVLAGDIIEGHGKSGHAFLPELRKLAAPLGIWAVNGNHETYERINTAAGSTNVLQEAGFHVLRDEWKQVRPGLVIAGIDDLTARRRNGERFTHYVDRALGGRPPGATIFVSHTPWLAERAAGHGAGLMLSGHTHDGQIWPFNYLVRLSYPLMSGRYDVAGMPVIVCRGTGTWGPRMRLWKRGEIVRIVLRSARRS